MRHSTNLALQVVPASAPPRRGAEMSALLCRLALGQQATSVARLIEAAIAEARALGLPQVEIRLRNALSASSKRRAS